MYQWISLEKLVDRTVHQFMTPSTLTIDDINRLEKYLLEINKFKDELIIVSDK